MQRVCAKCGGPIPPKTNSGKDRKYCLKCSPPRGATPRKPAKPRSQVRSVTIVDATAAELDAAGVAGTSVGLTALMLARRIQADVDSGSSLANLARQLRETMTAALALAAPAEADPLDELTARRDRRSS